MFLKRLTCPKKLLIANKTLKDFKQANKVQRIEVLQTKNAVDKARWVRPVAEYVKVNWDASLDIKKKRMGMGVVIRDEKREALVATCDNRMNV